MSDSITLGHTREDLSPYATFEPDDSTDPPSFEPTPVLQIEVCAPPQKPPATGRIPSGVTFEGSITGTAAYEVNGTLAGGITLDGADLHVKEGATVTGTVSARNAVIAGKVSGEIACPNGCVTFSSAARCDASLEYGELVVERGAKVNAQLRSTGD